jgi:hypothetical protein
LTFIKGQKKYAKDANIKRARNQLLKMTEAIFQDLLSYYETREKKLATGLKTTPQKLRQNVNLILKDFTKLYKNEKDYSLFGVTDNYARGVKLSNQYEDKTFNVNEIKKALENLVQKNYDNLAQKNTSTATMPKKLKKESVELAVETASWASFFAQKAGFDPESIPELAIKVTNILLYGGDLNFLTEHSQSVQKFFEKAKEAQPHIATMQKELQVLAFPFIKSTREDGKKKPGDPRASIRGMIHQRNGFMAEPFVTDLFQRMIDTGAINIASSISDVSTKDVPTKISDSEFIVSTFIKQVRTLGVDIKTSTARQAVPGTVKYTRGQFTRKFSDIFNMLDSQTAKVMAYLISNSFFFQDIEPNYFKEYLEKQNSEIYQILNAVRALLALLPSGQAVPNDLKNIKDITKQDDRFIVVINEEGFLMTDFLKAVQSEVLEGSRGEGTIGKKFMQDSLTGILTSFDSQAQGVKTGLYTNKLQKLQKSFKSKAERAKSGYQTLYNSLIKKNWKSKDLTDWQFRVSTTSLTVRKGAS